MDIYFRFLNIDEFNDDLNESHHNHNHHNHHHHHHHHNKSKKSSPTKQVKPSNPEPETIKEQKPVQVIEKPKSTEPSPIKSASSAPKSHVVNLSKPILSCIGAVIKRTDDLPTTRRESSRNGDSHRSQPVDYADLDEDDFKSKHRSSGLSSVVKVSERKYSVPKSMQPNKNILLRAVDDANNSVKTSKYTESTTKVKSIADEKLEKIRQKRGIIRRSAEREERHERPARLSDRLTPKPVEISSKRLKSTNSQPVPVQHDRREAVIEAEDKREVLMEEKN